MQWPRVPGCDGSGTAENSYGNPRSGVAANRSYPMPEVRAEVERSYPTPEVREGGREEQLHVQAAAATQAQEG